MSHKASEGWLGRRVRAAMTSEIDALRAGLAELTQAVEADRAEIAEMRARTMEIRAEIADQGAELRAMIHNAGVEICKTAAHAEDGLNALRAAMEGDERIEMLRLRVEGVLAQHRWDTDQLRQAVTALAERILPATD